MHINLLDKYKSFYFVGIGGISMSALALLCKKLQKKVGGSDECENENVLDLQREGIDISVGDDKDDLENYEAVVCTDAIKASDIRIQKAKKLSKPIILRGLFLAEISKKFKCVIAVSGCHGKTTCSAMLAHIFYAAHKKFTAHIGGRDLNFKNLYACGYDYFITEACEYKKNFLYLEPDVAVVLNIDSDHMECYGSLENLRDAYFEFADKAKTVVTLYSGKEKSKIVTFGYDEKANFSAKNIRQEYGRFYFDVCENGELLGGIRLNAYGEKNILNALAAMAVARSFDIPFEQIKAGLESFFGVERRFEFLGEYNGALCIADYAHHPCEIISAIDTAKKVCNKKLFVVFQPHTYSRTKLLFDEFICALLPIPDLLIYRTFAAREYYDDSGSAFTLYKSLKNAAYGESVLDIKNFLNQAGCGDTVLFLGAGDIYYIAKNLCDN